jgi:hypothetical protein
MDIYKITEASENERLEMIAENMTFDEMLIYLEKDNYHHRPEFQAALKKAVRELKKGREKH